MKSLRYFIEKEYFEEKAEEMANSELHQMQKKKVQKEEANKNRGTSQEWGCYKSSDNFSETSDSEDSEDWIHQIFKIWTKISFSWI